MAEADKSGEMLAEPPARQGRADADPFRLAVLFLAALIGFCLTLMVAIFGTLHNFPAASCNPAYRMLGGVLTWISISAFFATVCALFAQLCRYFYRLGWRGSPTSVTLILFFLMVVPVVAGAIAVGYCILGGAAILNQAAVLPGWRDAIGQLWLF